MVDDIDPFADVPDLPSESGLSRMSTLFAKRQALDEEREELEARLKVVKEELRDIDEKTFPDLFDEVGVSSITIGNRKIEVLEKLYGSLPSKEDDRERALEELDKFEGLGILKAEVKVTYTKGEAEIAKQLQDRLLAQGVAATLNESAHPQTYQAWAREQLAAGRNIDLEVLGLYNRRFIKIT